MKTVKHISLTVITTIALVLLIAFGISGTVISQSKHAAKADAKYYKVMEQDYVKEIRRLLTKQGYENSGVTMTKVVDSDGSREYTVTIHHKRLDNLSEEKRRRFMEKCSEVEFPIKECQFSHEFL